MPTGAVAGLGARLLAGSYYGQTIQIWSALFMAAALAATLVMLVGFAQFPTSLRRMGEKRRGICRMTLVIGALLFWLAMWWLNQRLVAINTGTNVTLARCINIVVPVIFGLTLLVVWELITRGLEVPTVLLPPPSMIWVRILNSTAILWADFQQTILKAVIAGYILGCGSGFLTALLIDRSPFLQRGLLPLGNFISALPIIGVAPIMVMWFGFDWQSKAAVVVDHDVSSRCW